MPEKRILLEYAYFDMLGIYLNEELLMKKYLKQMCLIFNKVTNDQIHEKLLEDENIPECTDWTIVQAKKKVLKFKIKSLLSILDTLDIFVDKFCNGEKVIIRKRHYSTLYSQLVKNPLPKNPSSDEVRLKIREITGLLSIMLENNLIKAYKKANKYYSATSKKDTQHKSQSASSSTKASFLIQSSSVNNSEKTKLSDFVKENSASATLQLASTGNGHNNSTSDNSQKEELLLAAKRAQSVTSTIAPTQAQAIGQPKINEIENNQILLENTHIEQIISGQSQCQQSEGMTSLSNNNNNNNNIVEQEVKIDNKAITSKEMQVNVIVEEEEEEQKNILNKGVPNDEIVNPVIEQLKIEQIECEKEEQKLSENLLEKHELSPKNIMNGETADENQDNNKNQDQNDKKEHNDTIHNEDIKNDNQIIQNENIQKENIKDENIQNENQNIKNEIEKNEEIKEEQALTESEIKLLEEKQKLECLMEIEQLQHQFQNEDEEDKQSSSYYYGKQNIFKEDYYSPTSSQNQKQTELCYNEDDHLASISSSPGYAQFSQEDNETDNYEKGSQISGSNMKKKTKKVKKRKVKKYLESEVETISKKLCMVNVNSLVIKFDSENEGKDQNSVFDSDEEYYQYDERENFHYNQDLLDYDIVDVLGDNFKFDSNFSFSKEKINQLLHPQQQFYGNMQQKPQLNSSGKKSLQVNNQNMMDFHKPLNGYSDDSCDEQMHGNDFKKYYNNYGTQNHLNSMKGRQQPPQNFFKPEQMQQMMPMPPFTPLLLFMNPNNMMNPQHVQMPQQNKYKNSNKHPRNNNNNNNNNSSTNTNNNSTSSSIIHPNPNNIVSSNRKNNNSSNNDSHYNGLASNSNNSNNNGNSGYSYGNKSQRNNISSSTNNNSNNSNNNNISNSNSHSSHNNNNSNSNNNNQNYRKKRQYSKGNN